MSDDLESEVEQRPHLKVEGAPDRDVYCNGERLTLIDEGFQHIELEHELDNGYTAEFNVGYDGTLGVGVELYKFPVPDPVAETELECTDGEPRPTFEGELRGDEFLVEIVKRDEEQLATDGGRDTVEAELEQTEETLVYYETLTHRDHTESNTYPSGWIPVNTGPEVAIPWMGLLVTTLPSGKFDRVSRDTHLSHGDAVAYSVGWLQQTVTEEELAARRHYWNGIEAINEKEDGRAIYELEGAVREYERLHSDIFAARNQFTEGQPRRELFELLWGVYYHLHEAVVAWSNSAIAAQDDTSEAATWRVGAISEHSTAVTHIAEWYQLSVEWAEK